MSLELIAAIIVAILLLGALGIFIFKRKPRRLKPDYFAAKWKELQQYCRNKETWPQALVMADKLLDEALKKRRYKGKSMGERMVSAQRKISNNDSLWYAHNLCKKAAENADIRLKEADVKQALMGIRQALKDLGAFKEEK
jgi:hypothetical protein